MKTMKTYKATSLQLHVLTIGVDYVTAYPLNDVTGISGGIIFVT